ncbi:MAG: hypothetical protein ACEPOZ_17195 [Marinifilaceae bacterium]|jgi:regulator of cell morphogenesis and NO signaling
MLIKKNMKMADVVLLNHMLIPVIHRFGINLGFGDKTVEEICQEGQIDLNFFLELVNAYHDSDYFPNEKLQTIPAKDIVAYLKMTHANYLNEWLTEIESKIDKLRSEKDEDQKYISLIKNFFEGYRSELTEHILREEELVFPYVIALEQTVLTQTVSDSNRKLLNSYSIQTFHDEHDDIEEKLLDLKTIMIKYLNPPVNILLYHKIIQELFKLEEDLNYHSRIENNVLIPKVKTMEKLAKNLL